MRILFSFDTTCFFFSVNDNIEDIIVVATYWFLVSIPFCFDQQFFLQEEGGSDASAEHPHDGIIYKYIDADTTVIQLWTVWRRSYFEDIIQLEDYYPFMMNLLCCDLLVLCYMMLLYNVVYFWQHRILFLTRDNLDTPVLTCNCRDCCKLFLAFS